MKDPLAGKREALNRGETNVLTWPGDGPGCPVKKGESFKLRSCSVTIASTDRALIKGKWVHRARVIRHVRDVPRLPAQQQGQAHPAQYVSNAYGALPGVDDEVPEDYQRQLAAEGHKRFAEHRAKVAQEDHRGRERAIRDRIRVTLRGLRPEGQLALLAELERALARAQGEEAA